MPIQTIDPNQTAFENADALNGMRLYDKFYQTGTGSIAGTNFLSPVDASVNLADITGFGDFYRCKQCHGWDQLGNTGAYIDRAPTVTRPEVGPSLDEPILNDDPIELFTNIKQGAGDGAQVDPARTADGTVVANGGGDMPEFGKILTDDQIWDIVKFLKTKRIDTKELYDITITGTYPTGTKTFTNIGKDGDATAGNTFLANNCLTCHGADGNAKNLEGIGLGQYGRTKPYEIQFQAVSGHLGSNMMGVNNATITDIKNMLKALQDTTKYPDFGASQNELNQMAFANADALNGMRLYDKFFQKASSGVNGTNFTGPVDTSIALADITNFGDFYRCKQCHGWDQLGNTGAYIDRAPTVTRPEVGPSLDEPIKNDDPFEIFTNIKQGAGDGAQVDPARTADGTVVANGGGDMPEFGKILTDDQIWDIVKFLKTKRIDTNELYDLTITGTYPTGTKTFTNIGKDGDAAAGDTFLSSAGDGKCLTCHGADGNGIDLEGIGLGQYGRTKPYEIQYQAVSGHLGSNMMGANNATVTDIKNMLKALQDTTKYPDRS